MKTKTRILLITLTIAFLSLQPVSSQSLADYSGKWMGTLVVNESMQLRIGFHLFQDEPGKTTATVSSIDQGAFDIPIKSVDVENGVLSLDIEVFGALFTGNLQNPVQITGTFTQGENPFNLNLEKVESFPINKPARPQEPQAPYSYKEEQVVFENKGAEGVSIAGTLTLPGGEGPHPAAILISGSGPNDRDANIFGHKVFLVLADYLTRQGIAVLRTDDRGVAESTGDYKTADIHALASDVVAACKYLESRDDIAPDKIGLIGHSHGASVGPVASVNYEPIAFNVLMAGSATSLSEAMVEQTELIYAQMGISKKGIALNTAFLNEMFRIVASEDDQQVIMDIFSEFLTTFDVELESLSKEEQTILELVPPIDPSCINGFLSPTMKKDLFLDPADYLRRMDGPVLAINGDKDIQVPVRHLYLSEKLLKEKGNQEVTIREFKDKNHLFQTAVTGSVDEYQELEETMSPEVLSCISEWINQL
jgi:fermentation-respiration switch protein FrsA (DUF1100 family)